MKYKIHPLLAVSCVALAAVAITACESLKHESAEEKEPAVIGSIRPSGHPKPSDLPGLTKISLQDAMTAALAGTPGTVITAELEVEDGNLQYSFDVVGADKSVTEVEIDAGNGKILNTEKEDGQGEDKD